MKTQAHTYAHTNGHLHTRMHTKTGTDQDTDEHIKHTLLWISPTHRTQQQQTVRAKPPVASPHTGASSTLREAEERPTVLLQLND